MMWQVKNYQSDCPVVWK